MTTSDGHGVGFHQDSFRGAAIWRLIIYVAVATVGLNSAANHVTAIEPPDLEGGVTMTRCVWQSDAGLCAWNLMYPFAKISSDLQVGDALAGTNALAR